MIGKWAGGGDKRGAQVLSDLRIQEKSG